MDEDAKLKELKEAVSRAKAAYLKLQNERDAEHRTLMEDVHRVLAAKYGARLKELSFAVRAARAAYEDAVAEAATGKLKDYHDGILIEWGSPPDWRPYMGAYKKQPTGRRGRYELRARETQFAANVGSWRKPVIGEVFIRLIKKDGTPGTGFVKVREGSGSEWLPEGQEPKQ